MALWLLPVFHSHTKNKQIKWDSLFPLIFPHKVFEIRCVYAQRGAGVMFSSKHATQAVAH